MAQYDAFISYRHLPLDKAVATRLQALLERVRPPMGVKCKNVNKISRIFRDETELPTSGDLGQDIYNALEQSSYLIVLCSPKLKESKWCMQEIAYFKKLHNGRINNILPILVEGDHAEVFPDALRFDMRTIADDNGEFHQEETEVEPLACNINADGNINETLKKLKTEHLRIAAPILGCSYDDLYQRHRKRRIRRIIAAACFSVVLTFLFLFMYLGQMYRVIASRDAMYTEMSFSAFGEGDFDAAMRYALQATQPRNRFMPQRTNEARLALINASGIYDLRDWHRPQSFEVGTNLRGMIISEDGNTIATRCNNGISVTDTQTFESRLISTCELSFFDPNPVFLNNSTVLFSSHCCGLVAYCINENRILWGAGIAVNDIAVSANQCTIAAWNIIGVGIFTPYGELLDVIYVGEHRYSPSFVAFDRLFAINADGTLIALGFDWDTALPITIFDWKNSREIELAGTAEAWRTTGAFSGDFFVYTLRGWFGYGEYSIPDIAPEILETLFIGGMTAQGEMSDIVLFRYALSILLERGGDIPVGRPEASLFGYYLPTGEIIFHEQSFDRRWRYVMQADERGIYISRESPVPIGFGMDAFVSPRGHPPHGHNIANIREGVRAFAVDYDIAVVASHFNNVGFFNAGGVRASQFSLIDRHFFNDVGFFDYYINTDLIDWRSFDYSIDFVVLSGGVAAVASLNSQTVTVFRQRCAEDAVFIYDMEIYFDRDSTYAQGVKRTRFNADRTRVMRFSNWGFRLFDTSGELINKTEFLDVWEVRYSYTSGNLVVAGGHQPYSYLRIYCGYSGARILEKTGIFGVSLMQFGVALIDNDGTVTLIDLDLAQPVEALRNIGNLAGYFQGNRIRKLLDTKNKKSVI